MKITIKNTRFGDSLAALPDPSPNPLLQNLVSHAPEVRKTVVAQGTTPSNYYYYYYYHYYYYYYYYYYYCSYALSLVCGNRFKLCRSALLSCRILCMPGTRARGSEKSSHEARHA